MVVSLNMGTPFLTPKFYNPRYKDTQNGTPNFGKLPILHESDLASRPAIQAKIVLVEASERLS